jgi:AAA domain
MRIVISGTYCSGKTTTTATLAEATGLVSTRARTMRELMAEYMPGRALESCSLSDLIELCVRRFRERVISETSLGNSFVSDGCALHEWIYAEGRLRFGINPSASSLARAIARLKQYPAKGAMASTLKHILGVMESHSIHAYDQIVHLPIEFPIVLDGHRPVSESFRRFSEEQLLERFGKIGLPMHIVRGSVVERVEAIARQFNLPIVMPVADAFRLVTLRSSTPNA